MTRARISITIPESLLEAADRRAEELDRSRSWVVSEAVRGYLNPVNPSPPSAVHEPAPAPYAVAEVAEARRRHLRTELGLSPAERLRRAEELGHLARSVRRGRGRRVQVIGFESYEDYYEWKKRRLIGA